MLTRERPLGLGFGTWCLHSEKGNYSYQILLLTCEQPLNVLLLLAQPRKVIRYAFYYGTYN